MTGHPDGSGRRCQRCGHAEALAGRRTCGPCFLAGKLDWVLDDGTGAVSATLQALRRLLLDAPNPVSVRCWLYKPNVASLLGDLATGRRPLTHEALHEHPHPKLAGHRRALLVTCGLLPAVDKLLLDFEAWLYRTLAGLAEHPHERLLRQFGHWHQLPRLRAAAARGPLRPTAQVTACRQFNAAVGFLTWTHDRCGSPASLRQADIDTWYTPTTSPNARPSGRSGTGPLPTDTCPR